MKNFTPVEIKYDTSNFQDCNVFLTGKELTARKIALQTLKPHTVQGTNTPSVHPLPVLNEREQSKWIKITVFGNF